MFIYLNSEIRRKLMRLAKKTGKTKIYCVREAILEHIDEMEQVSLALERLKNPGRIYSAQEVDRELGL